MFPLLIPSFLGVLVFSGTILFGFVFVSRFFMGVLRAHLIPYTCVCGFIVLYMRARVCFVMSFLCFLFLLLCICKYGFFSVVKGLSYF